MSPVALPVLPPSALADLPLQKLNYNLGETIGWPQFARTVASVYQSLPPADRRHAVLLTENYGEAGALDRYGAALGLPPAYSGHNSYWWWGPPPASDRVAIAVGLDPAYLRSYFAQVTLAARNRNPWGVSNDEESRPISICRDQRASWAASWPALKHYG